MNIGTRLIMVCGAVFVGSSLHVAAGATWDAATDFSATSNPNGAWSYGWSSDLTSALNLYPDNYKDIGLDVWADLGHISMGAPSVAHNGTANPITNGPASITWQPGQLSCHPGRYGENSHVCWTAPCTGTFDVAATFTLIDTSGGATDVHVLHKGTTLFEEFIGGFGSTSSFSMTVTVGAGDVIDFAVGWGSNYNFFDDSTALSATISQKANPPVASFKYVPEKPRVRETVQFDASDSKDPDGTIVRYEWDFGDGSRAEGIDAAHAYSRAGRYSARLKVTDNDGLVGIASTVVAVCGCGVLKTGDVSGDWDISAYDAALASQYSVGLITLTGEQICAADVDGNGEVTSYDAALIAQYAVGLIDRFPADDMCDNKPPFPIYVGGLEGNPTEDGTSEDPFHSLQGAIDIAPEGAEIVVRSGRYIGGLNPQGKSIQVVGAWLTDPNVKQPPVIEGPVILSSGADADCVLAGLTIDCSNTPFRLEGGRPTIAHCVICGYNITEDGGAVIDCRNTDANFINCTITGNLIQTNGAVLASTDSHVVMVSSILWGNTTPSGSPVPPVVVRSGESPQISYSDVELEGGWLGTGNISADPLFVAPMKWTGLPVPPGSSSWVVGDCHLLSKRRYYSSGSWVAGESHSPCIDAGDPAADWSQEPAPNGSRINMGAYGGTGQASLSDE